MHIQRWPFFFIKCIGNTNRVSVRKDQFKHGLIMGQVRSDSLFIPIGLKRSMGGTYHKKVQAFP